MLEKITPVVLTYNEEPNITRNLEKLSWAKKVIVVDSNSADGTVEIVSGYPNTALFSRAFDSHANQWNYAIAETGVETEWILALDADYILTDDFVEEIERLAPDEGTCGYEVEFVYCSLGKPLRGAIYPPVIALYRKDRSFYKQDGHTQRIVVNGAIKRLKRKILHDDRKSLSRWLSAQDKYMKLEAEYLTTAPRKELTLPDRLRLLPFIAPILVFLNCYFFKRGFMDGSAGVFYALQRVLAELILSVRLIEVRAREKIKRVG